MTDFDLGDPAPDADEEPDDDQDDSIMETTTTEQPEPTETVTETEDTQSDESESKPDPADAGPAFDYSEVRQTPLYARAETWDELDDEIGITVTPALRRMGIRDDELREIHDAVLEVALENIDEVADRVAEKRRES